MTGLVSLRRSLAFQIIMGGFGTTVNLIGNGTLARLRADPSLLPAAVEELLRFTSPLNHATDRFTTQDMTVGGVVIPAGELSRACPLGHFAEKRGTLPRSRRAPRTTFRRTCAELRPAALLVLPADVVVIYRQAANDHRRPRPWRSKTC
jgi:hypothetical protein